MTYILIILIIILSYVIGSLSTARLVTKSFRSLNIYKVGTGLADTENIFVNVSKSLGLLVGLIDAAKSYLYLTLIFFFTFFISNLPVKGDLSLSHHGSIMMVYAVAMLIGHCLPLNNKFRGGRGIFTYLGMAAYFAWLPTLITLGLAGLLVFRWKQIRFAQYVIVILPVFLTIFFDAFIPYFRKELPPYYVPMAIGMMIIMGALNFIVSKKLGEF